MNLIKKFLCITISKEFIFSMEYKIMNGTYYIKIDKDENLLERIRYFSKKNEVCGSFSGIGAANKVTISTYLPEEKNSWIILRKVCWR